MHVQLKGWDRTSPADVALTDKYFRAECDYDAVAKHFVAALRHLCPAYEKKYGTEAEREQRREATARATAKAMAERESLERDEQMKLSEAIKASLSEVEPLPCVCILELDFAV